MKSQIFIEAIQNRNRVQFLFGLNEVVLEPYYLNRSKNGKKVLYGKPVGTNEIKKYEYGKICNIRILTANRFYPIIPIIAGYN